MPEERPPERLQVLLDENVDRLLKPHFHSGFKVSTVPEQGGAGLSDADVLQRAEARFDVLVTMDQSLPYQQKLAGFELAVVVLKAPSNAFSEVAQLMPKVNEEIRRAQVGEAILVAA
jgi:hypothetical protein